MENKQFNNIEGQTTPAANTATGSEALKQHNNFLDLRVKEHAAKINAIVETQAQSIIDRIFKKITELVDEAFLIDNVENVELEVLVRYNEEVNKMLVKKGGRTSYKTVSFPAYSGDNKEYTTGAFYRIKLANVLAERLHTELDFEKTGGFDNPEDPGIFTLNLDLQSLVKEL